MKIKRVASCLLVLSMIVVLTSCGKSSEPAQANIFEYAIDTSNNCLLPKQIDYLMSVEDVLDARKLDDDAAQNTSTGSKHMRIVTPLQIEGFEYEVIESLIFQEDKALRKVGYYIKVDVSEYKTVCAELYKQAKEVMPTTDGKLEKIKDGGTVLWEDAEGNAVGFSVADNTSDEGKKAICIEMSVSETKLKEFFDTK